VRLLCKFFKRRRKLSIESPKVENEKKRKRVEEDKKDAKKAKVAGVQLDSEAGKEKQIWEMDSEIEKDF
jgi:hypothetical protein